MSAPLPGGLQIGYELHGDGHGMNVEIRWAEDAAAEHIPWMAGHAVSDALKEEIIQPSLDERALTDMRIRVELARFALASRGDSAAYKALVALEQAIGEDNPVVRSLAHKLFGEDASDVCPDGPIESEGGAL